MFRVTKTPRFSLKLTGASTRSSPSPLTSASTACLAILTASSPSMSLRVDPHTQ